MSRKTKIIVAIVAVIAVAVIAISIHENRQQAPENNIIRIGAILTLSGNVSYWSHELKKGMDLAAECINTSPNQTFKINIKYEDNAFNQQKAISAFNKLNLMDNIDVFISCFTPMCEALSAEGEKSQKPILFTITSATDIAANKKYIFRDYITQQQQCPPLAKYVYQKMGLKKGVYLVLSDDYGRDGVREFTNSFRKVGGKMMGGEYFSQNDLSLRGSIVKILSSKPDFVFIIAGAQPLLSACRQIREVDKSIQIVGLTAFDSDDVWDNLKDAGNGIVFSSGYFDKNANGGTPHQFYSMFYEKYKKKPNATNIYGFSIIQYLYTSNKKSRLDRIPLTQCLSELSERSIRGHLQMNKNHDIVSPIGLYQRVSGETILREIVK